MSRRLAYLAEIGVPVYALRRRAAAPDAEPAERGAMPRAAAIEDRGLDSDPGAVPDAGAAPDGASPAVPETTVAAAPGSAVPEPPVPGAGDAWGVLAAEVGGCRKCALHRARTQTVFGVGRRDAALLVVGEAPGEEEDRQGEPFVGRAGRLLNAMLRSIGYPREEVYIANILKCRPPGNRDPKPDEADACAEFLDRQIALIRPRAMLAVGRVSAQRLLGSDLPVGKLRGVVHRYGPSEIPLVVTYHPAYLLRTPIMKAKSWQDLCMLLPLLRAAPEGREAEVPGLSG